MKQIQLLRHGRPDEACACVEVEDVGAPEAGEVVVAIEAAAINPADLLSFEGRYPGPETLPAPVGIEGAGRVVEVGAEVEGLAPGDKVMSMARANWAERLRLPAAQVVMLPEALDIRQAAMLKANPPSAHLMLEDYVDLRDGDWVIQNAANSAVGRHVIRLARGRGLKTVNVVRREALIAELTDFGADLVLVDGEGLAEWVRAETGAGAPIRLAIDAVGGSACERLADCLSEGGVVVNYGFLSGEACRITPGHLIIKGLTLTGFWLYGFARKANPAEIQALYDEMAQRFIDGTLEVPIEAEYGLDDIAKALAHAHSEGRGGKILLRPGA